MSMSEQPESDITQAIIGKLPESLRAIANSPDMAGKDYTAGTLRTAAVTIERLRWMLENSRENLDEEIRSGRLSVLNHRVLHPDAETTGIEVPDLTEEKINECYVRDGSIDWCSYYDGFLRCLAHVRQHGRATIPKEVTAVVEAARHLDTIMTQGELQPTQRATLMDHATAAMEQVREAIRIYDAARRAGGEGTTEKR